MQRLSLRFYDRNRVGTLVGRVTTDVEALYELFSSGVVTILGDFVFLFATLAVLFAIDWRLALVSLAIVPVLLGVTAYVQKEVRAAYELLRQKLSQLNAFLHEHTNGMPLVQLFRREELARAEFAPIDAGVRDSQLETVFWESTLSAAVEMLSSFTTALILWYGGGIVAESIGGPPGTGLTLGALYLFVDYMQKFFRPLSDLSQKYTVFQDAMTAARKVFGVMDQDDVVPEPERAVPLPPVRGEIEFRDVTFAYGRPGEENEPALRGVSFALRPGEKVAIVGDTGAGKTTILKLLTRLYHFEHGSILVDGLDIRDYPLAELRRRVGIVPQDVFLFEGTLLDNIVLGHPEVDHQRAARTADRLRLDEVVRRFPNGYAERVSERGKNLSAGEKQLVAFARVLATEPEILVLDEATSNVDTRTEQLLQAAVHEVMRGRTSLVIAHRLSTVRDVDRILVLKKGRLVEQGTHEELVQERGVYWRLWRLQYGERERSDGSRAEVAPS
jgi:ABC-type multidrug transport system fused ATPase/permease subunit